MGVASLPSFYRHALSMLQQSTWISISALIIKSNRHWTFCWNPVSFSNTSSLVRWSNAPSWISSHWHTFPFADQCQLIMHSIDTNINTDDVVVLSPSGTLYFSLLKQTFETFGIEASARSKADKKHDKHGNVDGPSNHGHHLIEKDCSCRGGFE